MSRVLLTKLKIKNLGPIIEDEISFNNFTFFVGRNNAGKSHYLKAVELTVFRAIADAFANKESQTPEEMYEKIDEMLRFQARRVAGRREKKTK